MATINGIDTLGIATWDMFLTVMARMDLVDAPTRAWMRQQALAAKEEINADIKRAYSTSQPVLNKEDCTILTYEYARQAMVLAFLNYLDALDV